MSSEFDIWSHNYNRHMGERERHIAEDAFGAGRRTVAFNSCRYCKHWMAKGDVRDSIVGAQCGRILPSGGLREGFVAEMLLSTLQLSLGVPGEPMLFTSPEFGCRLFEAVSG